MKKAFVLWHTLPRIRPYLRPFRKLMVISLLLTLVGAAAALAEPWPLAIMVDNVLGEREPSGIVSAIFGEDPSQYALLVFAVLIGFLVTFLAHGVTVITEWVNAKLEQRMVLDLRSDLFNHCQGLSLTFHDARLTGQLMNQINYQASALGAIVMAFPPIIQSALTLVGMLIVAALIDWQVALVSLVAVPFIWWSLGLYGTRIVPRLQRVQQLEWQSLSIVHEAMAMLRVIVSFGREKHEYKRFRSQGEVAVDERVKLTLRQTLFSLGVTSATALGTGLVLGFGALHVIQGKITVGELLVLIAYVAAVYQPLEQISTTIGNLNEQFVQFNSAIQLLDTPKEVEEAPGAIELGRSRGRVTFENVGFAYTGRADTLRDVTFTAEPAQRVAIVGPTGAGKTTLMSLLVRFYDPHAGRVAIDGIDIRRLKLASLREQISVVLQEPLLFSGTIAENIRYGRLDATMDDIVAAAKAANAHEFIERQPQGYDTLLGERGAQLSGGERQRISVARAFVKDAPILVLDEPTSSIDSKTEGVILDALEDLMEDRTSFMIAHRLSTVRDADLILVVNDGRVVEQGSHEELLELDGIYRQLHEAQNQQRRRRAGRQLVAAAVGAPADDRDLERVADGDFDPPPEDGPETREEALAAGDFDALGGRDGDGEDEPTRAWPEVDEIAGAQPTVVPMSRTRRRRRLLALVLSSLVALLGVAALLLASGDDGDGGDASTPAPQQHGAASSSSPSASAPTLGEAAAEVERDDYGAALEKARALPPDQELRIRRKIGRRLAVRAMVALEAGDRAGAGRLLSEAAAYPDTAQARAARERLRGGAMSRPKVVVLGMMTKMPVAGVVWQTAHYLLGFERLGFEAHYVETHARTPSMLMSRSDEDSAALAAGFIDAAMRRFGLGDRWAYVALHDDGRHFGRTERELRRLYDDAELIVNLHGGTTPRGEFADTGRLVYLETDPVQLQVELAADVPDTLAFLEPHVAFFTFAENLGGADCSLPVPARFDFRPTRQPVVTELWETTRPPAGAAWTTVGNWRQRWRDVHFAGETYTWSKHHEWEKVLDLPRRSGRDFELALSGCEDADRARLAEHGWSVADGLAISADADRYREYLRDSRGELTVAKDQNVRLRTGWFSDRSATYLAAGRPVVTQDTGFGAVLPTGEGLFAFATLDEAAAAVEEVERAPERHRAAAAEIAREHFEAEAVLGAMLEDLGVSRPGARAIPADLDLTPVARRPLRLDGETERRVAQLAPARTGIPASVVIVTFGDLLFTKLCLESVLANTATPGHEVVVVDNGSPGEARAYLAGLEREHVHVRVKLNERNAGFAAATNQGLRAARGDALVLLNNDTIVTPGWLDGLLAHLDDPRLGLVGAVTNRSGTAAEIPVAYETYGELATFARERARQCAGARRELATPTMFCLALRRETYERVGPLDERFEVGMLEDDDYARRVQDAGLACACAEDVFVHHFGEASFGALVPTGEHARVLTANKERFEEKWGEPWQPYDRRPDPAYDGTLRRTLEAVAASTPAGAPVAVVSRGDERFVAVRDGRAAWHFPLARDGRWAGHHPADGPAALRELEAIRARGARFLVFPRTAYWWLDFYGELSAHLQRTSRTIVADDDCIIFELGARHG